MTFLRNTVEPGYNQFNGRQGFL